MTSKLHNHPLVCAAVHLGIDVHMHMSIDIHTCMSMFPSRRKDTAVAADRGGERRGYERAHRSQRVFRRLQQPAPCSLVPHHMPCFLARQMAAELNGMVLRCEKTGKIFFSHKEAELHGEETGLSDFAQVRTGGWTLSAKAFYSMDRAMHTSFI